MLLLILQFNLFRRSWIFYNSNWMGDHPTHCGSPSSSSFSGSHSSRSHSQSRSRRHRSRRRCHINHSHWSRGRARSNDKSSRRPHRSPHCGLTVTPNEVRRLTTHGQMMRTWMMEIIPTCVKSQGDQEALGGQMYAG